MLKKKYLLISLAVLLLLIVVTYCQKQNANALKERQIPMLPTTTEIKNAFEKDRKAEEELERQFGTEEYRRWKVEEETRQEETYRNFLKKLEIQRKEDD